MFFEYLHNFFAGFSYYIGFLVVLAFACMIAIHYQKMIQVKEEKSKLELELRSNEAYLEDVVNIHDSLDKKHILLERLRILSSVVDIEDENAVNMYIKKTIDMLDNPTVRFFSCHAEVNALLNYYQNRHPDYVFHMESSIDNHCGVLAEDLTTILMCIMDMRMEAIGDDGKDKTVQVKVFRTPCMLCIMVMGSLCREPMSMRSEDYSLMMGIIQKYDGVFSDAGKDHEWNMVALNIERKT